MMQNLTDHLNEDEKKNKIRQRLWKVRAKKVILATGSIERMMVFDCNDRPGIMLSSAVRKYLNHYAVKCGNNVVIFANNDDAYETAISLHNKWIKIKAIIDIRENSQGDLVKKCLDKGLKILWKHTVVSTGGRRKVNQVSVMKLSNNNNSVIENRILIDCDLLAKVYINLIDQKEPTLNFQNEELKVNKKNIVNADYFKKIIQPTVEELEKHKEYLKNNLKKNFF